MSKKSKRHPGRRRHRSRATQTTESNLRGGTDVKVGPAPALSNPSVLAWCLIATILIATAVALRWYRLGTEPVWLDEAYSALLIRQPSLAQAMADESNPPLYFLLLKGFCALFGDSPEALRTLSVLFGGAAVAAVVLYAARARSLWFALGAGVLLALSPYSLYYSQEARPYSLLILELLVALGACQHALKHGSRGAVVAFALAVLAAGYTHYFAVLALLPVALWLTYGLATGAEDRARSGLLLATLAVDAVLCAIWALPSLLRQRTFDAHLWVAEQWQHLPKAWIVPRSLLVLLLGSSQGLTPLFMKQWTALAEPRLLTGVALAACLVALGCAFGRAKRATDQGPSRWTGALLFGAILLPLAALLALSFLKPLYVVGRYDVVAFPYLVWLGGWVVERLGVAPALPRIAGLVSAAILAVCLGVKDGLFFTADPARHEYDAARTAALLDRSVHDREMLVFPGLRGTPVLYYLTQAGYDWDGEHCHNAARDLTLDCRILPYTDTGVPFAMNASVTTPVTPQSVLADFTALLTDAPPSLWWVTPRELDKRDAGIELQAQVALHRNAYARDILSQEQRDFGLKRFQKKLSH
jgi:hypothetical protein